MHRASIRTCAAALVLALTLLTLPAAAASASPFSDVPQNHWAVKEIRRSAELGLIRGETAARFGLGHSMTRGAFVTVLCRFFSWEDVTPDTPSYTDTDRSVWCWGSVEAALQHGAITRQTEVFRPGDPITREEMAVMLVRALGYGSIAGLDQGLACPFTDVASNAAYLTMAYHLGIVNGTTATTFSPRRTATREQAVVMLIRLYDRWHYAAPARMGLTASADAALAEYTDAALTGAVFAGALLHSLPAAGTAELFCERARGAVCRPLLGVTLSGAVSDPEAAARQIAEAAAGYDGVLLQRSGSDDLPLCRELRTLLGTKRLCVTAVEGENIPALAACADLVILQVSPAVRLQNDFPTAPQEPPEAIYRLLAGLRGKLDFSKLCLYLSTEGRAFYGSAAAADRTQSDLRTLLTQSGTRSYYSARYAQHYLTQGSLTVWYPDADSLARRAELASFFGVSRVCLEEIDALSAYDLLSGLKGSPA